MRPLFLSLATLFCVLLVVPLATAQKTSDLNDREVFPNLCDPDFTADFAEEFAPFVLDHQQLERLYIELLERGYDPGFDYEAGTASRQLRQALKQYQSDFELPVTGAVDSLTLNAMSIPIEKSTATPSDAQPMRAKPSQTNR